ncbi:MAG: Ser-Thr-rich GPI-anchored membrane family protein [Ignavibacteria bacterium]
MKVNFLIFALLVIFIGCRQENEPSGDEIEFYPTITSSEFQIISPKSGDIWYINQTYEIKWLPSSKAKFVIIKIFRKNTLKKIISSKTENDGSFFYNVHPDLESSNLYKIELSNYNDSTEVVKSNYFSIRQ